VRTLLGFLLLGLTAPVAAQRVPASESEARIARFVAGMPEIPLQNGAPLRLTLAQWQEALGVPGVSVAVIDNGRIAWARGFGIRQAGRRERVTAGTLFQAGSIAKPVTALAALQMVEHGELSLDGDINASLTSWRVPESPFTATRPVTLRGLLAHTSGITPRGFPGYEPGTPVPTVVQILNGQAPANTPAAVPAAEPGAGVDYSGLGYTIVQLAMTERANEPFPQLMQRRVFAPLDLQDSSFEQPLPTALTARAASGHDPSGLLVSGRWRIHPEMAAAGLWTTASDLARIAIAVARSRQGRSSLILSEAMTRRMLTQEMNEMGVGWVVRSNDTTGYFAHNGGTVGYRAHMRMTAETGQGVVILTNSDNGSDLFAAVVGSVAAEYGWENYTRRPVPPAIAIRLIAHARGVERALAEYRHMRATLPANIVHQRDLNVWGYVLLGAGRHADAIRVFRENVTYHPDDGDVYDSLGEALLASGDETGAIREYRRSLELDPTNENARAVLARLRPAS